MNLFDNISRSEGYTILCPAGSIQSVHYRLSAYGSLAFSRRKFNNAALANFPYAWKYTVILTMHNRFNIDIIIRVLFERL